MNIIQNYFDKIFIINLKRRKDRWDECLEELDSQKIPISSIERFEAFDCPENGHAGCTRSHRELIRAIASSAWNRVLIMEDDFAFITMDRLKAGGWFPAGPVIKTYSMVFNGGGTFNERFEYLSGFFPNLWDVLYLGACYGEPPISRLNQHVIRCGFMQTTGSYGITNEFAKIWDAKVNESMGSDDLKLHPGPIDNVFGSMSKDHLYYITQPRMMYQRKSLSDLDGGENSRLGSGTDTNHESMV